MSDTFLLVTDAEDPMRGVRAFSTYEKAEAAMTDIFGELKKGESDCDRDGTWTRYHELDWDEDKNDAHEWVAEIHTVCVE